VLGSGEVGGGGGFGGGWWGGGWVWWVSRAFDRPWNFPSSGFRPADGIPLRRIFSPETPPPPEWSLVWPGSTPLPPGTHLPSPLATRGGRVLIGSARIFLSSPGGLGPSPHAFTPLPLHSTRQPFPIWRHSSTEIQGVVTLPAAPAFLFPPIFLFSMTGCFPSVCGIPREVRYDWECCLPRPSDRVAFPHGVLVFFFFFSGACRVGS